MKKPTSWFNILNSYCSETCLVENQIQTLIKRRQAAEVQSENKRDSGVYYTQWSSGTEGYKLNYTYVLCFLSVCSPKGGSEKAFFLALQTIANQQVERDWDVTFNDFR